MTPLVINKHKVKGVCSSRYCMNKTTRTLCGSCASKKSRLADPVRYSYNNLKHRAKERNKEFTLTLDEFRKFCHETLYIQGKGKTVGSYNIDRIDNDKGYTIDNIQVMEKVKNIKKYYLERNPATGEFKAVPEAESTPVPPEDLPF